MFLQVLDATRRRIRKAADHAGQIRVVPRGFETFRGTKTVAERKAKFFRWLKGHVVISDFNFTAKDLFHEYPRGVSEDPSDILDGFRLIDSLPEAWQTLVFVLRERMFFCHGTFPPQKGYSAKNRFCMAASESFRQSKAIGLGTRGSSLSLRLL
jgi:hypothetical protein